MEPNLATFLNLQWGLKEGVLGYPFGTVDYGKAPVGDLRWQYGEAPTRGPNPYFFTYHFWQKDTPFVYFFWYSFHKASLELNIPLTAANSLSFK